jgi:preprotein translocase subunit SecE
MEKLTLYLRDSYDELMKHVTWPSIQLLQESTVIVLLATLIISLIIFLMDGAINFIVNLL